MTDATWMTSVIAEAEPIEEKPEVRAVWFDTYADALRLCRTIGATDTDGVPVFAALQRMSRLDARFFTGIARKGGITIAYTVFDFPSLGSRTVAPSSVRKVCACIGRVSSQ